MSIASSRRSYDHRLRTIINDGCEPSLLEEFEIPRSTIASWQTRGPANVVTLDDPETIAQQIEILKLRRRVKVLAAVVGILKTKNRVPDVATDGARIPKREDKTDVLVSVARAVKVIPLISALRILDLSSSRYHSWKRSEKLCALDDRDSCPKTFPNQLTPNEIVAMRQMVTGDAYKHIPMRALALLGQRQGTVFASVSTWAKLTKARSWKRPRKRLYPAKPKFGVRATKPNEIWHIDVTIFRLVDGTKVFIHGVIDNFSRRILAWKVSRKLDPTNTCEVLTNAGKKLLGATPDVYVDGGVENFNNKVDELHNTGVIKRVLAQIDVAFSNSMIEAFWRSLKHQHLFLHQLDTFVQVQKLIEFYVTEHNTRIPHAAFRGQTPDEIYFGNGQAIPDELANRRVLARKSRLELNRSTLCEQCTIGKSNDSPAAAIAYG